MDWDAAPQAVTKAPARALGVHDTHGTLEPGKRANVVVWSGDPFELMTSVRHVFIGGTHIEDAPRQKRLMRRYREREDLSPAYDDGTSQ
jgi:imidazolonepropionase-like amidohydrolase